MATIKTRKTKTLVTKPNNNSANAIAPNVIHGCFGGCLNTYCYMSRYNGDRVFVNKNVEDIFDSVVEWARTYEKKPDQQDPVYKMVDVACNTDLVLMQKHMPEPLEDYLKRYDDHPEVNSTMATKYPKLLTLDVNHFNKPPRVRISLMPQVYSDVLEPKMELITSRLSHITRLKELGWQVHLNFSPIIFYPGWEDHYEELFKMAAEVDPNIPCEMIALTNHERQMMKASVKAREVMKYSNQVKNNSGVMRYPIQYKRGLMRTLVNIYCKYFDEKLIRYKF